MSVKPPKDLENWLRSSYLDGYEDGYRQNPFEQKYDKRIKELQKTLQMIVGDQERNAIQEELNAIEKKQKAYARGRADGSKKILALKGGL